MYLNVCQR